MTTANSVYADMVNKVEDYSSAASSTISNGPNFFSR